ncbi:GTP 3',8-cyclase MoaA [Pararobbsia silviterrae]|uniref:GTP 3',8-cyclase n=1 Tax=Pararobbsia silviterrae TaxID=1792498 RepID=A0A494Y2G9_9BURK|nr:GTP 3',8-cyclase MoaA [Pararobbsia silviterrae]RKP56469.1 GTP 3',8-cyclase MoaA [Pararobbsia silviterrae]
MSSKIIPVTDWRSMLRDRPTPDLSGSPVPPNGVLTDTRGRALRDLRISITDRCNFRCVYCMPKEIFGNDHPFLPHAELLTFEEIERLATVFVAHGVRKIRLTGGEPLLRRNIEHLIERLASLRTPEGDPLDLSLTTNGSLLARKAHALRAAGLRRLTVSLDALDDSLFRQINDADFPVAEVLDGIDAAREAGFGSIKVNMVVKRGTNDHEIVPMARHFRGTGVVLRFIEYMDVGTSNGWRMDDVVASADVIAQIAQYARIEPVAPGYRGETAERWRYSDGSGEFGTISSVTRAFCGDCTRVRLSTEGKIYLCLFASQGYDLRALLRAPGLDDAALATAIARIWHGRGDHYSEIRASNSAPRDVAAHDARRVEMSYIGG